jgi:putative ABC transport system permease protein
MSTLWAASVRHLLRHPAQLTLALTGLALGVATITAVDIATASSSRAFELAVSAVSGPATDEIAGGPEGIDETLYVRLVGGYPRLAFAPVVEGYVAVRGEALQLVGVDPLAEATFQEESAAEPATASAPGAAVVDTLAGLGRWLTARGAAAMAPSTADRLGIPTNRRFEVDVDGKAHQAVLIAGVGGEQAGRETLLLADIAQAQEWLGVVGRLSRIEVRAPPGAPGDAELARLREELPPGVELEPAQQRSRATLDMTRAFTTDLRAMSLLALLVGLFLIYSAVSFAVLQRRKIFAVLRALGATRLEILRLVMAEAAVLGALGALLGLAAGIGLGRGLIALVSRTINDLYFVVAVNSVSVPVSAALGAVCAGILTALVAALLPAWEATHVAPQLGLRRSALESRALGLSRWLLAASAAFGVAAGAIVAGSSRSLLAGFAALFLLLISVAALTPALLGASARLLARLLGRASPVGRIALADVAASLSRTGVAVASLALALAAVIGVSVMVGSFRESLHDWLRGTMRADVYVAAPGPGFGRPERRLDPAVIAALASVRGVSHYSARREVTVSSPQGPVTLEAVTLAPDSDSGIEVTEHQAGVWPAFARGAILVAEPFAWRLQLHSGDRLTLGTAAGPRSFVIAGIYRDYGSGAGVLMDRAVYRHAWGDDGVSSLGLYLSPGVTPHDVIPALYAAAAGHQALLIGSSSEVRALSMSIFDQTFVITRVLDWLAAGVAAIGLVSSLLAWELERSRELGILRALGLEPRAAALLIEAQTAFMGLVALLAAIPAGLLAAELLVTVINRRAFGWKIDFHLHGAQLAGALRLALIAALLAGLYPAWRTARAPIAADIREE